MINLKENPVSVLLIGYGSIGKRHARNLIEMGIKPIILTQHPDELSAQFVTDLFLIKDEAIDYCIISSPTCRHFDDLKKLRELKHVPKKILIEKPVEVSFKKGIRLSLFAKKHKLTIFVAYNLRFLPAFDQIRAFIQEKKTNIRIVEIVAGQDLREWRKGDYTRSYSAHRKEGGGVDLDLSHEVDYLLWLFGKNSKKGIIYRNHISSLDIDSPDIFTLTSEYDSFVAYVMLDYIRKPKTRYLKILCEDGENLFYDLVTNTLEIKREKTVISEGSNDTYRSMLRAFLDTDPKKVSKLCTLQEGLEVLKTLQV